MNEWYIISVQSIIIVILYIASLFLKNAFPKYFEAKATNQATKEDIGDITKIVESIKVDLNKQTEELRAQLLFVNQHKLSWKAGEREAIFDYNRKIIAWQSAISRFSLSDYTMDNYDELFKIGHHFNKLSVDVDISEGHLFLFIDLKEYIDLRTALHKGLLEYQYSLTSAAFKLLRILIDYKQEFDENPQNKLDILHRCNNDCSTFLDEFNKSHLEKYEILNDALSDMQNFLSEKLKGISTE